jgi:hypothetical protein
METMLIIPQPLHLEQDKRKPRQLLAEQEGE